MFRIIILYLIATVTANLNSPIIQISSGKIQGQYIQSKIIDKPYYSFRGIPYAEPPVGKLRFQPPVKPKPWTNTLETKNYGSRCMQRRTGSEDCLFLNVYTPSLPSNGEKSELLPVMVFVHGGVFAFGSSDSKYGPEYLIDKNIVLVAMNYRLNIFGFLNALDESAPGNAGLKDQVAALEWVQENIEKFNGDPKKVTIFGQSAGSIAVQYLLQSKLAKGLYHKAIMLSGSSLNNWAFENNPMELNHKLGKLLNIESKNATEFINSLQNLSSEKLFKAFDNKELWDDNHRIIRNRFVPSLEFDSPKALVTENSYSVLNENVINHVPLMVGYTSNEALLFLKSIVVGKELKIEEYEINPTWLVPKALNINNNSESLKSVWNEIKNHYFNNVSVTNITAFINFQSDETFVRGIRKSVELLRQDNDIYYYVFDYKDKNNTSKYPGVGHFGVLKYLFYTGAKESDEDKIIREKMTTLWTNFAKTGNPTPNEDPILDNVKWPIVSKTENDKLEYLSIEEHLQIKENPGQKNFEFWEKVFKKYGKTPFSIY